MFWKKKDWLKWTEKQHIFGNYGLKINEFGIMKHSFSTN